MRTLNIIYRRTESHLKRNSFFSIIAVLYILSMCASPLLQGAVTGLYINGIQQPFPLSRSSGGVNYLGAITASYSKVSFATDSAYDKVNFIIHTGSGNLAPVEGSGMEWLNTYMYFLSPGANISRDWFVSLTFWNSASPGTTTFSYDFYYTVYNGVEFVYQLAQPVSTATLNSDNTYTIINGSQLILNGTVTGGVLPLTYLWSKDGLELSTDSVYAINSFSAASEGVYRITVTDSNGTKTYKQTKLWLGQTPSIITQPASQTVMMNSPVTFTVTAAGPPTILYQWYKDVSAIIGATSSIYTINYASLSTAGQYTVRLTNYATQTSVVSSAATLTVNAIPIISGPPNSQTIVSGSSVTFTVVASGSNLSYKWFKSGTLVSGPFSGPSFSINYVTTQHAGGYYVEVTNTAGTTRSATATLTVTATAPVPAAPVVTTQPTNVATYKGRTVTFQVFATGSDTLAYQWKKNGALISGATSWSYTFVADLTDAGNYTVTVSNAIGSATSAVATLTVLTRAPYILTQPSSTHGSPNTGDTLYLMVDYDGTPPITYQWYKDGKAVSGATGTDTSAWLPIRNVTVSDSGIYYLRVQSQWGSASSNTIVVNVAPPPSSPIITKQPISQTGNLGEQINFSVVATGTGVLTYQWFKNGVSIVGANTPTWWFFPMKSDSVGVYSVSVTNAIGTVTSDSAVLLSGLSTPVITTQPVSRSVNTGSSVTFSVSAVGVLPLSYQWFWNGSRIPGETGSTLSIAYCSNISVGTYTAAVTNAYGSVYTDVVTLAVDTVAAVPLINIQPSSQSAVTGSSVSFRVSASGTAPLTYQWYYNTIPIVGANQATYTMPSVTTSNAGRYTVQVSNTTGTVSADAVILTVSPANTAPESLLTELSVRTTLASGQRLIPGFVTNGSKILLMRAGGPALTPYGLSGLTDPQLQVYNSSSVLTNQNDNWDISMVSLFNQLGAYSFATYSKDSALTMSINGPNTAFAFGSGVGTGTLLFELYDTDTSNYTTRLMAVSARNQVGTGADVLIAGFVIGGTGTKKLLIRGVGPKLAAYGVTGVLADPYLEIYNVSGTLIASIDNWDSSLSSIFRQVGAFDLDVGSKDAAILITLPVGVYTAKLSGVNGGTGEALIEVYEIWP